VSPNQVIPVENGALSPIAERVLKVPSLTYDYGKDGIVIAVKADLIVRRSPFDASPPFRDALAEVADRVGSLADIKPDPSQRTHSPAGAAGGLAEPPDYDPGPGGELSELDVWRLKDPRTRTSIDESRRLRALVKEERVLTAKGAELSLPAVSPNHVAILSPAAGGCPAAPPTPAPPPDKGFVEPPVAAPGAKVTILDSGYIWIAPPHPPHHNLDGRVTVVLGQWLDTSSTPPTWRPDRPDGIYRDPAGQLDGISGHGTFIAGLVSHIAPDTSLEVVGLRNQEVEIGILNRAAQLGLFETEVAIAHAMLRRCDTDVIQCGFAFPTLDDYPSLPFAAVMAELRQPSAPRNGRVAVVAPAGNEQSARPYWPAALPDVIGVASTNRRGNARAWFSNWGDWCDCCTRGEHVYSTFVYWHGSVEGEPLSDIEHFRGWARWDGTSFAAPKVSAAIANVVAGSSGGTLPMDAWNQLIAGAGGVPVSSLTDATLSGPPGVPLTHLHIW